MPKDIALITGASSGIGASLARRLAREGRHLVLSARRVDRLETLAQELQTAHGIEASVIPADLGAPGGGGAEKLAQEIEARGLTVDWLLNNAGFGTYGKFSGFPVEKELQEIQLNIASLVELTGRLLPGMIARGRGAVINTASVAGFAPGPYMATYCATKAFVVSFSEAIAEEVRGTGVHVLCVCPGFTRTEFQEQAEVKTGNIPDFAWMTADEVADQAVQAVGRKSLLVNGTMNSMTTSVMRLLPQKLATRLVGSAMRRATA